MNEVRAVVEAHVRALNQGDLAAILDSFTPDATFSSAAGDAVGRAELAGIFDTVAGGARPKTIIRSAAQEGSRLRCTLTRRFRVTDEEGASVHTHDVDVEVVFTVRDGAIAEVAVQPV